MASQATIFKTTVQISDLDRKYYQEHVLTLARHPSETNERMMVRLLAFMLHAQEALVFGHSLSTENEPDLWQKDLTGAIELWIEVGQREEKSLRQACGRAKQVYLYTYGGRGIDQWWEKNFSNLSRLNNLTVINIPLVASQALAQLAKPTMHFQCTIQEGLVWVSETNNTVQIALTIFKPCTTS